MSDMPDEITLGRGLHYEIEPGGFRDPTPYLKRIASKEEAKDAGIEFEKLMCAIEEKAGVVPSERKDWVQTVQKLLKQSAGEV